MAWINELTYWIYSLIHVIRCTYIIHHSYNWRQKMEINISTNQLLPALQILPRADKLRIIQFLVLQLAQEEGINSSFVINNDLDWKDTTNAADTLFDMLMEDKLKHD
jgi:hypothetical protein